MKIYVTPQGAWDFYEANKETMDGFSYRTLAEDESGTEIVMSVQYDAPYVVIMKFGDTVAEEECVSEADLRETLEFVYGQFLDDSEYEDPDEPDDHDLMIMEREDELNAAVADLLSIVLDRIVDENDELVEEFKERTCSYLADEQGFSVYRPMYLEDENGEDFFEEYPYDCLIRD